MVHILVVEDDIKFNQIVCLYLQKTTFHQNKKALCLELTIIW